jgi:hypothetical protein
MMVLGRCRRKQKRAHRDRDENAHLRLLSLVPHTNIFAHACEQDEDDCCIWSVCRPVGTPVDDNCGRGRGLQTPDGSLGRSSLTTLERNELYDQILKLAWERPCQRRHIAGVQLTTDRAQ